MLKKMDKKFLYICGGLILLPLLFIILLVAMRGCSGKITYNLYESKMVNAAQKYFKKNDLLPKNEGEKISVSLDELVKNDYLKSADKSLKEKNCTGSVSVRNNGISVKENKGGYYLYIPNLVCDGYKSTTILDKLLENVVESQSGLYKTDDGYVFKGAKVNNYLSFFGKNYRIISIDNDGIMKLVKVDSEKVKVTWDNKYNTERNRISGKNDYSDSNIIDELRSKYLKMAEKNKKHLIGYSVCYGNRSTQDRSVSKTYECSKKLDNQFLSILNTYDYAMASYDSECVKISSGSCRNYNYLYKTLETTWLMNGLIDNTYEVYYYSTGVIELSSANASKKYNLVIYLDGSELYTEGNGTLDKPYVIK